LYTNNSFFFQFASISEPFSNVSFQEYFYN
jgi:hypothetical protein